MMHQRHPTVARTIIEGVPPDVVEALEHDLCEQCPDPTQLSSTVPASSGAVREVHQDGVVPPRIGRRVVLVPASRHTIFVDE